MDLVVDIVAAAIADASLIEATNNRIFGFLPPREETALPYIVVTAPSTVPAARPTRQWKNALVVFNIHSNDPNESNAIAMLVDAFAPTFVGIHGSCVVQDSQVESILPVTDDGWSPTRFRNVVTVDLTAREP